MTLTRGSRLPPALALGLAALGAVGLAACGTTAGSPEAAAPAAPPSSGLTKPVPTTVATDEGAWATVPVGQLDDPSDTFWQLLHRPAGSSTWSDHAQATAAATNGGLDLTGGTTGPLVVGVRPADRLLFSPLVATGDGGRTWQNGLLPAGLSAVPDALATGSAQNLALVTAAGGQRVMAARGSQDLLTWNTLITESQLAAEPASQGCGVKELTAVAAATAGGPPGPAAGAGPGPGADSLPVVGARCTGGGAAGVFVMSAGRWRAVGPLLSGPSRSSAVLDLEAQGPALTALVASGGATTTETVTAAWSAALGQAWRTSPPLSIPVGGRIVSFGPAGASGRYVLWVSSGARLHLDVASGPGAGWHRLAPPPTGTEAVVLSPGGPTQALAVRTATLTVWSLPGVGPHWAKAQVMNVAIDYGSSG
jgi:hypothetical protein